MISTVTVTATATVTYATYNSIVVGDYEAHASSDTTLLPSIPTGARFGDDQVRSNADDINYRLLTFLRRLSQPMLGFEELICLAEFMANKYLAKKTIVTRMYTESFSEKWRRKNTAVFGAEVARIQQFIASHPQVNP